MTVKEICEKQTKSLLDALQEQDVPITSWVEDTITRKILETAMMAFARGQLETFKLIETHQGFWTIK